MTPTKSCNSAQRSLVVPALIVGASAILGALIIKGVKLPSFHLASMSEDGVRSGFIAQMTKELKGVRAGQNTFKDVRIEWIKYNSQRDSYDVRYTVAWTQPTYAKDYWTGVSTGCDLSKKPNSVFYSGSCTAAPSLDEDAPRPQVQVQIQQP